MKPTILLTAVLTISVGAGGYALVGGTNESPERTQRPITRHELDHSTAANVYDAVNRLRNNWLSPESLKDGDTEPTAYIELRCEEVACLRWIEPSQVERIEYLARDSSDGQWPWSTRGAAIVVSMRTQATGLSADTTSR